jgi:hypothetical protein
MQLTQQSFKGTTITIEHNKQLACRIPTIDNCVIVPKHYHFRSNYNAFAKPNSKINWKLRFIKQPINTTASGLKVNVNTGEF